MSDVAVIVPLRITDRHRLAAWQYVQTWWGANHPDWPVTIGTCGDGPWSKGAAVADAASRTAAATLIVADADVWCDGIAEAAGQVQAGVAWAMPHTLVHRLNEDATKRVLAGEQPGDHCTRLTRRAYVGVAGGGLVVVAREVLDATPMDSRFRGWGQEDGAWALALETLHGPCWRGTADLWHLYHPPAPRMSTAVGSPRSRALHGRYQDARGRPDAMRRLVAEIHTPPDANAPEMRTPVQFVSPRYPQLHVPAARVRFRNGEASTSNPEAIAALLHPKVAALGVQPVDEEAAEAAAQADPGSALPATENPNPSAASIGEGVSQPSDQNATDQEPDGSSSPPPDGLPTGGAKEILTWVGDDTDRARQALAAEQAREKPRSTLVAALTKLAG